MAQVVMRDKPAYGDPCNNCGHCCIAVQCPLSLIMFGEQEICPSLGMAEPGNFGCRLVENPGAFIEAPADAMPVMAEYHALLIGAGAGCDGQGEDEEVTEEQRAAIRARATEARRHASHEALAMFNYVTESPDDRI
jgi:hypothetical protein